jgi:NAD-dependent dihydropyrimidine dehydrogenase PreA subunit
MTQETWMPQINSNQCNGCGRCVLACPTHSLTIREGKALLLYPDRCRYCAQCEAICPLQAISLPYLVRKVNDCHQEKETL